MSLKRTDMFICTHAHTCARDSLPLCIIVFGFVRMCVSVA